MIRLLVALLLATACQAQALRSPPNEVRQWVLTCGAASATIDVTLTNATYTVTRSSRSLFIDNTDASNDALFNLHRGADAAAESAGGYNFRVRAGKNLTIDGEFVALSYIRAGATDATPVYVIVSY